jgi:hypothetical protein
LIPAKDVRAYVKRKKNDAADAEAIREAVPRRPTMRFVQVKAAAARAAANFRMARWQTASTHPQNRSLDGAAELLAARPYNLQGERSCCIPTFSRFAVALEIG